MIEAGELCTLAERVDELLGTDQYGFSHKHKMWGDSAKKALYALAAELDERREP